MVPMPDLARVTVIRVVLTPARTTGAESARHFPKHVPLVLVHALLLARVFTAASSAALILVES